MTTPDVVGRAAELGRAHALTPNQRLTRDGVPAAFGLDAKSRLRYLVTAAYWDSYDIARAEADPNQTGWPVPISPAHKAWLRANLVNRADLAAMMQVKLPRILRIADVLSDFAVIDRARKYWYWWPHLKPTLATLGLRLPEGAEPPAAGPIPSWWGDLPSSAGLRDFLQENLIDFAGMVDNYEMSRAEILTAGRQADYPEPVIDRPGNYWYWWPDIDRFLVRHREIE